MAQESSMRRFPSHENSAEPTADFQVKVQSVTIDGSQTANYDGFVPSQFQTDNIVRTRESMKRMERAGESEFGRWSGARPF